MTSRYRTNAPGRFGENDDESCIKKPVHKPLFAFRKTRPVFDDLSVDVTVHSLTETASVTTTDLNRTQNELDDFSSVEDDSSVADPRFTISIQSNKKKSEVNGRVHSRSIKSDGKIDTCCTECRSIKDGKQKTICNHQSQNEVRKKKLRPRETVPGVNACTRQPKYDLNSTANGKKDIFEIFLEGDPMAFQRVRVKERKKRSKVKNYNLNVYVPEFYLENGLQRKETISEPSSCNCEGKTKHSIHEATHKSALYKKLLLHDQDITFIPTNEKCNVAEPINSETVDKDCTPVDSSDLFKDSSFESSYREFDIKWFDESSWKMSMNPEESALHYATKNREPVVHDPPFGKPHRTLELVMGSKPKIRRKKGDEVIPPHNQGFCVQRLFHGCNMR